MKIPMQVAIVTAIVAFLVIGPTLTSAQSWGRLANFDFGVVVPIQLDGNNVCTAWRLRDEIYITVAHCTTDMEGESLTDITLAGVQGTVVKRDADKDLAAIFVPLGRLRGPSLKVSDSGVRIGQGTAAVGYGGGAKEAYFTFGYISRVLMVFPTSHATTMIGLIIYGGFIPAMSGGPILNERVEVISTVQATGPPFGIFQDVAIGIPQQALRDFVAEFLP